jgi:hypothetical protein
MDFSNVEDEGFAMLSEQEKLAALRAADGVSRQARILTSPRLTLFNGQDAEISFDSGQGRTFQFQAVCSDDRRSVRLASWLSGNDAYRSVHSVKDGETLMLKFVVGATSQRLLLVTPRIVVREEEEERLEIE